jgi:hypothetical protein
MKHFYSISILLRRYSKSFYGFIFFLCLTLSGYSQSVSVNTTGAPPDANAGLDISFPNLGFLIPRVALTGTSSAAPLTAHVAGMIVYNTATAGDVTPGFYYNNGTKWIKSIQPGNATGNMLYWDGSKWALIPPGLSGQKLQINSSGIPVWQ